MLPDVSCERRFREKGYRRIAGIDEAGRGCWAGPVVAAAVVLPSCVLAKPSLLTGINDSKALTERQRTLAYHQIFDTAEGVGVGIVPAFVIDGNGIVPATRIAMLTAVLSMPWPVDVLLIDSLTINGISIPQESLIRGDARCLSIAAASIIAKVTRDRLMETMDGVFPGYGFAKHKGYGTAFHQKAIEQFGLTTIHRRTFRPVTKHIAPSPHQE